MAIITDNQSGEYDLSKFNSLKDLREEIAALKVSIQQQEKELGDAVKMIPQQLVKSTTESIVPAFLNNFLANGTWKILLSAVTMLFNPFSGKAGFKKNLLGSAKKLGLMALVKGIYTAWNKKSRSKRKTPIDVGAPHTARNIKKP
jgi:hypothetical protein